MEENAAGTESLRAVGSDGGLGEPPVAVDSRRLTLARLADEAGAEWIAREAKALAERVGGGRFYVACLGQFRRGKSSLLNALLGTSLLPVGIVPVIHASNGCARKPSRLQFLFERKPSHDLHRIDPRPRDS